MTDDVLRQGVGNGRGRRRFGTDLAAAAADQALIGRYQGGVGVDPEPAVAREHLDVEMQVAGGAVGMIEIVRDHADLLAFGDTAAVENPVGIHAGWIHVHVAKADVFVAGVDLQRRGLLLRRTDHDAVADGDNGLLPGTAGPDAGSVRGAGPGGDTLPLRAKTAAALPDFKAAGFAKIIPPGIAAGRFGFV